jgi:hypothetical protein
MDKYDWDMDSEALAIPDAQEDKEEIVTEHNVFGNDLADVEAVAEVHAGSEETIVYTDVEEHNSWQRVVKHLNQRIGELEERLAKLEALLTADNEN